MNKRSYSILQRILCLLTSCIVLSGGRSLSAADLKVTHSCNRTTVPLYGGKGEILEITFRHERSYPNNFFDVTINVEFTSPSGGKILAGGFFYDTGIWKARLAPGETGIWTYSYTFSNPTSESALGKGTFRCVPSKSHGFMRQNPNNPFRWVFEDGTPFFPIGFNNGVSDWNDKGTFLGKNWCMDGGFRNDPNAPDSRVEADHYFKTYRAAGFNIFRFSPWNNSYAIYTDLDNYNAAEARYADEFMQWLREQDWRIFYGFFGFRQESLQEPNNAGNMEKIKRFLKYSVDRWGAYVDIWELLNERKAVDRWYRITAPYVRSIDPYRHPVTTSWDPPDVGVIDLLSPHWYQKEDELASDKVTVDRARRWKSHGIPVMVGEQGNSKSNWDERSALRMRIRTWTSFFNEISLIFWNTSYAKHGHTMNIYLGPEERQYIRVLDDFKAQMDAGIRMTDVTVSDQKRIRAYALSSKQRLGVYLHHYSDHDTNVVGESVTVMVPKDGRGIWINPADGKTIASFDALAGRTTLTVPPFTIDIALLVTPG
jgi:hypothetical protein